MQRLLKTFNTQTVPIRTVFSILLIAIFVTELAVMELLSPLLPHLTSLVAGLTDSILLILCLWPLLWFVLLRPLFKSEGEPPIDPVPLIFKLLGSIFVAEFLVMLALPRILPSLKPELLNLIDAALTSLVLAPLLWKLVFRRMAERQREALAGHLDTPLKLYVVLLFAVFSCDLLETVIHPIVLFYDRGTSYHFSDALLTTLFVAPVLWALIIRPLKRTAEVEKTYADAVRAQVVDAVATMSMDGVIEALNPAAERIFGYAAAETLGKPFTLLLADGHQWEDLVRSASGDGYGQTFAIRDVCGRHRDGSTIDLSASISAVRLMGRQQFIVILRDLTERNRAEASVRESSMRFRQIFEETEDAIIFFKPGTSCIIDANPTAERLYGYSKRELTEGGLALFCKPDEITWLDNVISGVRKDSVSHLDSIVNVRKDGASIIVSLHGKGITIQGVDITYCTVRDISARVRLEAEARDIQAKLIQANKMTSLGLLVSGVAHEINNPNAYIMAGSEVLARIWTDALKILREYQRENGDFQIGGLSFSAIEEISPQLIAGITDGAQRISHIVNNLKNFAREDQVSPNRSVDVNRVVSNAVTILHHQLMKYTENFHVELAEDTPPVKGSSQQLEQVVINLLMNACQALPRKEHGIWIATGYDPKDNVVTISVRDEGRGMTRDVSRRVLEPFFTTKLDSGGTGLGLSISQSIINEHNGLLEFESEPGKGTIFTVKLPSAAGT